MDFMAHQHKQAIPHRGVVGWCDGAGETSSAGASYNLDHRRAMPTGLTVGAGGGVLDIFTALTVGAGGGVLDILLSSILSFLFLPLFGRRPDIG